MDKYYTPAFMADLLTASCTNAAPRHVVDFSAGDGALLKSALARWPNTQIIGMDIDRSAIQLLATSLPQAKLFHLDFLVFSEPPTLGREEHKRPTFDVILMNPPFSCRGKTTVSARVEESIVRGSRALAFIARALQYLGKNGELIAILPSSCLTSERDGLLREALKESWVIEPIGSSHNNAFPRCSVSVEIIRVTRRTLSKEVVPVVARAKSFISRGQLLLMRGSTEVEKGNPGGKLPLIHSTELIGGKVMPTKRQTEYRGRVVSGTAVLLPRVGRPSRNKIAIKLTKEPVVLSSCVFAIKTPDRCDERALYTLLRDNWPLIVKLYSGSCALYITLKGLSNALEQLGYQVEQVTNMDELDIPLGARNDKLVGPTIKLIERRNMFIHKQKGGLSASE